MSETSDPDAPAFSWPTHWTPTAVDAAETVLAQRPDLQGAEWASLEQVCALITAAELQETVAAEAGWVSTGSTGQTVAHPCAVEARLARTAAATVLARLIPSSGRMTASEKGRAGARARYERRAA